MALSPVVGGQSIREGGHGYSAGIRIDKLILESKIWISSSKYPYLSKKTPMFSRTTEYALRAVTHLAGQEAVKATCQFPRIALGNLIPNGPATASK
jgi:hypothetical protein